jgi:exonuclease VII small subunit
VTQHSESHLHAGPSSGDQPNPPSEPAKPAVNTSGNTSAPREVRDELNAALRSDRSAAQAVYSAEARLVAARTAYENRIAGRAIEDGRLCRAALDNATRAYEAAESALTHCRLTLSRAIDELHTIAVASDERLVVLSQSSSAAAV